jgi:hypothetical protein
LPATPLAVSLVSLADDMHAARSLHRSFFSIVDDFPAAPLAVSLVSFSCRRLSCSLHPLFPLLVNDFPAAPSAASLVSVSCRRHARRAARCIARFILLSTSCPPRRSLHRSFFSLADVLPAAPLAELLVAFSCRLLARRATR